MGFVDFARKLIVSGDNNERVEDSLGVSIDFSSKSGSQLLSSQ